MERCKAVWLYFFKPLLFNDISERIAESWIIYYHFNRLQHIFNDTKVTILGLNPVTTYRFQVFADNGVSEQVPPNEHQFIDIAVTTEASVPSSVSNVRIINVRSTELTLRWDPPDDPYSDIEMYEVRYFMKGYENNATSMLINRPESAFTSLRQQTIYGFQVRAKTTHGWGDFSAPVYKTTGTVLGNFTDPPITRFPLLISISHPWNFINISNAKVIQVSLV